MPRRQPAVLLHKETTERVVNEVWYPLFLSLRLLKFERWFGSGTEKAVRCLVGYYNGKAVRLPCTFWNFL
jgi:hypothetical protein